MDATSVDEFNEAWEKAEIDGRNVIFDLDGLEYVSSAGLRCFLTAGKACMASKSAFAFCCIGDMVSELFQITGLGKLFRLYPTRQDALASMPGHNG